MSAEKLVDVIGMAPTPRTGLCSDAEGRPRWLRAENHHGGIKLDANTVELQLTTEHIRAVPTTDVFPTRRSTSEKEGGIRTVGFEAVLAREVLRSVGGNASVTE